MNEKLRALMKLLSECRSKLLAMPADATPETRSALTQELTGLETTFQAALAEPPEAPEGSSGGEGAEFRALEARVSPLEYFQASAEHRAATGPSAEYNAALKLAPNKFPMRLLAPPPEERTATAVEPARRPMGWADRLFAEAAITYLGFEMVEAAPGAASFPVSLTGGTGAQRGKEQTTGATAWTIGVRNVSPKRMTLRYEYSVEDDARVPGLESALLRDMRMAVAENVDSVVFVGDDGANPNDGDIAGLLGLAGVSESTLTQVNKLKGDHVLGAFVDMLDGLAATVPGDLRVVAAVGSDVLWRKTIHNSAAENQTISGFLGANGVMHRSREGISTTTASGQYAAAVGLQRGIGSALKCVMWPAADLVRDPYSEAEAGKVRLILNILWNYSIVRFDNLHILKYA